MLFKKKVLIVDDNTDILDTATFILESWGLKVFAENRSVRVAQLLATNKFDLVILDVNMPEMSGKVICSMIKKDPKTRKIPVMLLTGLGKAGDIDEGLNCGADEYVIKPVDWDRLKEKISKLINKKL